MGINNFTKFLRDKHPSIFKNIPISSITGQKVAIDANNWMHMNMYFATSKSVKNVDFTDGQELERHTVVKNWIDSCIKFSITWLENRIVPVFVFDGAYPVEKKSTQSSRKDSKDLLQNEIKNIKNTLSKRDYSTTAEEQVDRLRKLLARDTSISRDDTRSIQEVLRSIGLPVIIAPGEAEKHCSYLNIHGFVDYVFTTDSDALCFGCTHWINKVLPQVNGETQLQVIHLDDVLKSLDLDHQTFIDLCIMAGCDYNSNIPGIGIIKAFNLLKKHGCIENIPLDTTCLNYNDCRRLFKQENYAVLVDQFKLKPEMLERHGRDTLNNYGLAFHIADLVPLLNPLYKKASIFDLLE